MRRSGSFVKNIRHVIACTEWARRARQVEWHRRIYDPVPTKKIAEDRVVFLYPPLQGVVAAKYAAERSAI